MLVRTLSLAVPSLVSLTRAATVAAITSVASNSMATTFNGSYGSTCVMVTTLGWLFDRDAPARHLGIIRSEAVDIRNRRFRFDRSQWLLSDGAGRFFRTAARELRLWDEHPDWGRASIS